MRVLALVLEVDWVGDWETEWSATGPCHRRSNDPDHAMPAAVEQQDCRTERLGG
jgi:hypothetical protein